MPEHPFPDPSRILPQSAQSTNPDAGDSAPDTNAACDVNAIPVTNESLPQTFGRYEIRKLLGRGGMGSVYLAYDPQLDRLVALKVPMLESSVGEWRERFFAEARAAAKLTHPNICPVHDVGDVEGTPYLTMAYIEGETLASKLEREGRFDPEPAVRLVATVARAMAEAHAMGIVHRDLKPANLMLDSSGRPLVMDFGLAVRPMAQDDLRLTLTGVALGTPSYMPPEQAGGDPDAIGPPSDVYSLGVILYELVTGRVPFKARTFGQLLAQIERDPPPSLSALNPNVDTALEAVTMTSLAKAPADRFASAEALADALDRYLDGDHQRLTTEFAKPYAPSVGTTAHYAVPGGVQPSAPHPRKWAWLAGAAAFLFLVAAVAIYIQTDYGQVVVQLSDPAAKVDVRINGQEVTLAAKGGKPVRIRANRDHQLEVTSLDFETVTKSFDLKRGGVHVASVQLKPRNTAQQRSADSHDSPKTGSSTNDSTISQTPESEPNRLTLPKPVPYPTEPALIELPGWQIYADATQAQMQAWLDERKEAKHSVVWLDVFSVNQQPAYAAIAAHDNRAADWTAFTDMNIYDINPRKLTQTVNIRENRIQSISGFLKGLQPHYAMLLHPGEEVWEVGPAYDLTTLPSAIAASTKKGLHLRVLRGFSARGMIFHTTLFEADPGARPTFHYDLTFTELMQQLSAHQGKAFRPNVVSAIVSNGELKFAVVLTPDPTESMWEVHGDLTIGSLHQKAAELQKREFNPTCLTGYPWDGATRYIGVWTHAPKETLK